MNHQGARSQGDVRRIKNRSRSEKNVEVPGSLSYCSYRVIERIQIVQIPTVFSAIS